MFVGVVLVVRVDEKTRAAMLSVVSNSLLIVLKVVVGTMIGSVAVISEAINSGVDVVAAIIALAAVRISGRKADARHPYGHGKFENVSGAVEALLIFGAAAWIIYESAERLIHPRPVDAPAWGVAVMAVTAVVKALVSRRLSKVARDTDSVALRADAWNLRADVFTSSGVMLGLSAVWIGGYAWPGVDLLWVDPVIAIVVALFILKVATRLARESARDLLDVGLPKDEVDWIRGFVIETWPQVRSFHKLRTRKAGSTKFIDFHLVVSDAMSVGEAHALGDEIVAAMKQLLPNSRVQIHIEPCDHLCGDSCDGGCTLTTRERK